MSLIFTLQANNGGFFCQLWKLASNYLYAEKNKLQFLLDDSTWMFKHTLGWRDYFSSLNLVSETQSIQSPIYRELEVEDSRLHKFTLKQYNDAFKNIYVFNHSLKERLTTQRATFSLTDRYSSIMIRRGDKMYGESAYIDTLEYVKQLEDKNLPIIFVQTDDYKSYEEVCNITKGWETPVQVFTTCPPHQLGAFVFNYAPHSGSKVSDLNNSYLMNLTKHTQKSINKYSPEEMREHVEEMLIGMEICIQSTFLVTDFQSNVTRFLYCNSRSVGSVGDIAGPTFDTVLVCPAKGFIPA